MFLANKNIEKKRDIKFSMSIQKKNFSWFWEEYWYNYNFSTHFINRMSIGNITKLDQYSLGSRIGQGAFGEVFKIKETKHILIWQQKYLKFQYSLIQIQWKNY